MRERTTWNRDRIASLAKKLAEDPRAMNQDHLQQQPAADKYETGGPSEFAEDVHESGDTWRAEYQGEEVRRNEIGMPEFRPDTFKTAEDHEFLVKKADLCVDVARAMLGKTASDATVIDQALSFMYLPNAELLNTANRLAADDQEEDEEEAEADEQQAQAQQEKAEAQQEKAQGQQQEKQAAEQQEEKKEEEEPAEKQAAQQQEEKAEEQEEKAEQKQAAQQQEEKKEAEQEEEDDMQKQASAFVKAMCQLSQEQQQQLMAQMQQMMQQQPMEEQVQVQQDMPMDDDAMLSQMLEPQLAQDEPQMLMASDDEIQLESPEMCLGDVTASEEDEVLRSLFATDLDAPAEKPAAPVRTASTRTVGTRPSQGVSKLGGSSSEGGDDVAKLSNLWSSSPDVSDVFGR